MCRRGRRERWNSRASALAIILPGMRSTRFPRRQLPGGLALAMALQVCGLVGTPEGGHAQTGNVDHVATVAGAAVVVHAAGSPFNAPPTTPAWTSAARASEPFARLWCPTRVRH
jgi:hypothetical protein